MPNEKIKFKKGLAKNVPTQKDAGSVLLLIDNDKNTAEMQVDVSSDKRVTVVDKSKAPINHAASGTTYGAASASNYGHAKASSTTPKVAGTAAVGSETSSFARGDHVHPAQTSVTGNAGTATKLQTARSIKVTKGVNSEGQLFNGSSSIEIPVTQIIDSYLDFDSYDSSRYKFLKGTIGSYGMALSYIHSANRFAYVDLLGVIAEYSRDDGVTWTAIDDDLAKTNCLLGVHSSSFTIGNRTTGNTVQDKFRITLDAQKMNLYTRLRKIFLNISTNFAKGSYVELETATIGDKITFTKRTKNDISGQFGWNVMSIPAFAFGGSDSQTSNIGVIRLTFGITGIDETHANNNLQIINIMGFGDTIWNYPSIMAKTGHLYDYDWRQNAIFPAKVIATEFIGKIDWSNIENKPDSIAGPQGPAGPKGDPGAAAGFGTPTATINNSTGTPSVTVTADGPDTAKVFKFDFKNLKGATGTKGDGFTWQGQFSESAQYSKGDIVRYNNTVWMCTGNMVSSEDMFPNDDSYFWKRWVSDGSNGTSAGFGTPTATVNNNTGTPSVTVTTSGPNTAKVFKFDFKNLKGEKGDQGIQGPAGPKGDTGPQGPAGTNGTSAAISDVTATVDNNVGTPSVTVTPGGTSTNRTFKFDFKNLKGAIGPAGEDGQGFNWRGNWDSSVEYNKNDVVTYDGSAYINVTNMITRADSSTGSNYDPSESQNWELFIPKGTNGTTPTIKAAAGPNINSVGTPTVTATTSGTTTTFTFNNLKGEPGAGGSGSGQKIFWATSTTEVTSNGVPATDLTISGITSLDDINNGDIIYYKPKRTTGLQWLTINGNAFGANPAILVNCVHDVSTSGYMGIIIKDKTSFSNGGWVPTYLGDVVQSVDTAALVTSSGKLSHKTFGTAGTYGSATQIPVITTNSTGHITNIELKTISTGGSTDDGWFA